MADMHEKIGKFLEGGEHRDAIHVAIAPVIAVEAMEPGQHVGLAYPDDWERVSHRAEQLIGIIDPFLLELIEPNQRCWLFLYPNTIKNLRHDWTHPALVAARVQSVANALNPPADPDDGDDHCCDP